MSTKELTTTEELFLQHLEDFPTIRAAADATGISSSYGSQLAKKLKEVIQERTRDRLTVAGLRAANTQAELLDADANTVQGTLRLKASSEILDRMGATKHSSIEVSMEATNGIFILPGKAIVPAEPEKTED